MKHRLTRNNIVKLLQTIYEITIWCIVNFIPHSFRKTQPCGLCEPLRQQSLLLSPSQMLEVGGGPVALYTLTSILTLLSNSTNGPSA